MNTRPSYKIIFICMFLTMAFGLFSLTTPSAAQANQLGGRWAGTYYYGNGQGVNFTFEVQNPGQHFSGRITEPNTMGNNNARFLYAYFEGDIYNNGHVAFTKWYDGTANVGHKVYYNGQVTNGGYSIQGTWQAGNNSGSFILNYE